MPFFFNKLFTNQEKNETKQTTRKKPRKKHKTKKKKGGNSSSSKIKPQIQEREEKGSDKEERTGILTPYLC